MQALGQAQGLAAVSTGPARCALALALPAKTVPISAAHELVFALAYGGTCWDVATGASVVVVAGALAVVAAQPVPTAVFGAPQQVAGGSTPLREACAVALGAGTVLVAILWASLFTAIFPGKSGVAEACSVEALTR